MKLTFLGHACFDLFDGKYHVLTDPFLTGNALAAASADEVPADFICVSHNHGDHIGDAIAIAKRTGATIVGWTSLTISVWAIGGLILLSLGVIGEYIGKIYLESKARPRYIIQEYLDSEHGFVAGEEKRG